MVIEAVPEKVELKRARFAQLDRLADPDATPASNSASIPASRMIDRVRHSGRVLNAHYQQPSQLSSDKLMSCGKTDEGVTDGSMEKVPLRARGLSRAARERRIPLQPGMGGGQTRVPDGAPGRRGHIRGGGRPVEHLDHPRHPALPPHGPGRTRPARSSLERSRAMEQPGIWQPSHRSALPGSTVSSRLTWELPTAAQCAMQRSSQPFRHSQTTPEKTLRRGGTTATGRLKPRCGRHARSTTGASQGANP